MIEEAYKLKVDNALKYLLSVRAGIQNWAVISEDLKENTKFEKDRACYAVFDWDKDLWPIKYVVNVSSNKPKAPAASDELRTKYANWVVNESPWKEAFIPYTDCPFKNGQVINVNVPTNIAFSALSGLRETDEEGRKLNVWDKFLSMGFGPRFSYFLSYHFGMEDGVLNSYPKLYGLGGHLPFNNFSYQGTLINWINATPVNNTKCLLRDDGDFSGHVQPTYYKKKGKILTFDFITGAKKRVIGGLNNYIDTTSFPDEEDLKKQIINEMKGVLDEESLHR